MVPVLDSVILSHATHRHWAHGAVASHPMLSIKAWEPFRPLKDFIEQLKKFLESHARVDLDHPLNNITQHPDCSYSPLDRYLAQLEALTGQSAY